MQSTPCRGSGKDPKFEGEYELRTLTCTSIIKSAEHKTIAASVLNSNFLRNWFNLHFPNVNVSQKIKIKIKTQSINQKQFLVQLVTPIPFFEYPISQFVSILSLLSILVSHIIQ